MEPSLRDLAAYAEGTLDEAEAERLRDRFADDPMLAREYLELLEFQKLGEAPKAVAESSDYGDEVWRRLQSELTAPRTPMSNWWAVAALLVAVFTGLLLGRALYKGPAEGPDSSVGVATRVATLDIAGSARRDSPARLDYTVGVGEEALLAIFLAPARPIVGDEYRLHLRHSTGDSVVADREIGFDRYGTAILVVPTKMVPPGVYEVEILDSDGQTILHETFRVSGETVD